MGNRRQHHLNKAILRAVTSDSAPTPGCFTRFLSFFQIFAVKLIRCGADYMLQLRGDIWRIDEKDYRASFGAGQGPGTVVLESVGDLGYSGSTFFTTPDSKYLIKSLPRRFEYAFFENELLHPYFEHMSIHPRSLLVRITDFLVPLYPTLGGLTNIIPTHHIVMENIQYGEDAYKKQYGDEGWETYDLKPPDYFYPRRDLLPDQMTSEETMQRIINTFDDKIRITASQSKQLMRTLEDDTAFLQSANVVDYSLFIVRFPASCQEHVPHPGTPVDEDFPWRSGVISADGKWCYRLVLLDFFWARHSLRAHATKGAVQTLNVFARQEEMPITATAEDYRERFLNLIKGIVEVAQDE